LNSRTALLPGAARGVPLQFTVLRRDVALGAARRRQPRVQRKPVGAYHRDPRDAAPWFIGAKDAQ
jgi:hypothetical protein